MAIKLIAYYAKRLGLPGFSSHQFSVSMETELTDPGQVQGEAARLYGLLQDAVDREIQHVGFVPDEVYGMEPADRQRPVSPNGIRPVKAEGPWKCSDRQKDFILKLASEHDLDRQVIEELAIERFGHGVKSLNKLEASGLIDEILELHVGTHRRADTNATGSRNGRYRSSKTKRGAS